MIFIVHRYARAAGWSHGVWFIKWLCLWSYVGVRYIVDGVLFFEEAGFNACKLLQGMFNVCRLWHHIAGGCL